MGCRYVPYIQREQRRVSVTGAAVNVTCASVVGGRGEGTRFRWYRGNTVYAPRASGKIMYGEPKKRAGSAGRHRAAPFSFRLFSDFPSRRCDAPCATPAFEIRDRPRARARVEKNNDFTCRTRGGPNSRPRDILFRRRRALTGCPITVGCVWYRCRPRGPDICMYKGACTECLSLWYALFYTDVRRWGGGNEKRNDSIMSSIFFFIHPPAVYCRKGIAISSNGVRGYFLVES